MTEKHYIGLQLDWKYDQGIVDISMSDHITKLSKRLTHPNPFHPQLSPNEHLPYIIGEKVTRQYALLEGKSPKVDDKKQRHILSVVEYLLYYARSIDGTLLPALSSIATQ